MENQNSNQDLIKQRSLRAAKAVGIASFVGFSILLLIPTTYMNPFGIFFILGAIGLAPLGMLQAFIFAWPTYFIFKYFIKSKLAYRIALTIFIIIAIPLGTFFYALIIRAMAKTPAYTNEIDTNGDGKIDKWVYDNNMTTITTLDTDFDGKPDIKKYYNNGDLIKTENLSLPDKNVRK